MLPTFEFPAYLLSPVDHVGAHAELCFTGGVTVAFRVADMPTALSSLKAGVGLVLRQLPFLTGEVAWNPGDPLNRTRVVPASSESLSSPPILQIHNQDVFWPMDDDPSALLDIIDSSWTPCANVPPGQFRHIFRLQANVLKGGRLVLCAVYNHMAIDGTAFHIILQALAFCCQSHADPECLAGVLDQQVTGRKMLFDRLKKVSGKRNPSAASNNVPTSPVPQEPYTEPPPQTKKAVSLVARNIEILKIACNKVAPHGLRFTTNDIITTLLWLSISRASIVSGDRCAVVAIPVSLRQRSKTPLPAQYMGTTMQLVNVRCEWEQLVQRLSVTPLNNQPMQPAEAFLELATLIRQGILAADDASFDRLIAEVGSRDDWRQLSFSPPDLFISSHMFSSWSEMDFGPHLGVVRSFIPDAKQPNAVVICPRRATAQGDVFDVMLHVAKARMASLQQDPLMRWAMGVGES